MNLRVLVPVDNSGWIPMNPFSALLPESLVNNGLCVYTGKYWLNLYLPDVDIVNIQWPEHSLPENLPFAEALARLCSSLDRYRAKCPIAITIHNAFPHYNGNYNARLLYESIYDRCDGFVHMSATSEKLIKEAFPRQAEGKLHTIIPHGNYAVFGPRIRRQKAKEMLCLEDRPTALIIGALRSRMEVRLALRMMKLVEEFGGQVIFAGTIALGCSGKSRFRRIFVRLLNKLESERVKYFVKSVRSVYKMSAPVPAHLIATLVSASDIVLIPRANSLSSGNVALGFTYGSIVVGPNNGNIGETLLKTGNPVFSTSSGFHDLGNCLSQAFDLAREGHGEQNYEVAHVEWDWNVIGKSYLCFYNALIRNK
jgi:glycosyltransferase involved in cell wall biosynthesis